jgi:hypothetical protein
VQRTCNTCVSVVGGTVGAACSKAAAPVFHLLVAWSWCMQKTCSTGVLHVVPTVKLQHLFSVRWWRKRWCLQHSCRTGSRLVECAHSEAALHHCLKPEFSCLQYPVGIPTLSCCAHFISTCQRIQGSKPVVVPALLAFTAHSCQPTGICLGCE